MANKDLIKRLAELRQSIKSIKTSQEIGGDSGLIYEIASHYTYEATHRSFPDIDLHFTSVSSVFPKTALTVHSYTIDGTEYTPYIQRVLYETTRYSPNLTEDYLTISPPNELEWRSYNVKLVFSLKANTPGYISLNEYVLPVPF